MAPKVLMVAEKPSIALSIASVLSGGCMSTRRGSTEVHEFDGMFVGCPAHYKVTSVIGHVFSVDFPARYQDWNATNPLDLFDAPITKTESNPKAHIYRHLSQEARGCGHLVLWLDCDREGENICFEGGRMLDESRNRMSAQSLKMSVYLKDWLDADKRKQRLMQQLADETSSGSSNV